MSQAWFLSAGLLLPRQLCEVGHWGLGACSAPQSCRLGSGPSQEKGGNPGRNHAGPAVCLLGTGGAVSQPSSAAAGDALTLAKLLIAFVEKVEFSCPCCIIQGLVWLQEELIQSVDPMEG